MKTLLVGIVVGAVCGWTVQKFVLTPEEGTPQRRETSSQARPQPSADRAGAADGTELDRLRARIAQLEALLAARPEAEQQDLFGGVTVPATAEGIELLLEEFERTGDLDRLLALMKALLLQGEKGYPRLTKVLIRVVARVSTGNIPEEEFLRHVVPALKLGMQHEKELVGYVGYLLTSDEVPAIMRTGAMAAAMFLSVNRVPGSDAFGPMLLQQFLGGDTGAGLISGGKEQEPMLIEAMGFLREKKAVEPLLAMLRDPVKQDLQRRAIQALGRIGDPRAIGPLVQRLQSKPASENEWWRGSAEIAALARIGTPEATAAAEQYIAGIESAGAFFSQASSYLRARPSDKVVGMIRDRFRANPGGRNIWSAIWGLRSAGTPAAMTVLDEISKSATNPGVRKNAQRILDERKKLRDAAAKTDR